MSIPTLADVTNAWHGLPAEARDRIGVVAVDLVFQGFVYGNACVVAGRPEDRAVLDAAARDVAAEAEQRRLNELSAVVEAALPELFGPDGENPAWSENAGPVPTPAALAAVAREVAEEADLKRRERSLRIRLGRKGMKLWREHEGYVVTDRGSEIAKTDILDLGAAEGWLVGLAQQREQRP